MEVNRADINETGVLTALLFQQQPVPALAMIHVWALGGQELSVWVKSSFVLLQICQRTAPSYIKIN